MQLIEALSRLARWYTIVAIIGFLIVIAGITMGTVDKVLQPSAAVAVVAVGAVTMLSGFWIRSVSRNMAARLEQLPLRTSEPPQYRFAVAKAIIRIYTVVALAGAAAVLFGALLGFGFRVLDLSIAVPTTITGLLALSVGVWVRWRGSRAISKIKNREFPGDGSAERV